MYSNKHKHPLRNNAHTQTHTHTHTPTYIIYTNNCIMQKYMEVPDFALGRLTHVLHILYVYGFFSRLRN